MMPRILLDPALPVPLYRQVVEAVRAGIASGELVAGAELPGVRELATALRINYHTVARAWQELEAAGLVERQRGGPFRVAAGGRDDAAVAALREGLRALATTALSHGLQPDQIAGWWTDALTQANGAEE
jgi:GntR family transcriptional regulator